MNFKTSKKTRAQASFEFMQTFTLLFAVVVIFSAIFLNYYIDLQNKSIQFQLTNFAESIAGKINSAYLAGDGYSVNFYLPQKLYSENYFINLSASNKYLEVHLNDSDYENYGSASLLTSNIQLIQWNENQTIENINGKIVIKPTNLTN